MYSTKSKQSIYDKAKNLTVSVIAGEPGYVVSSNTKPHTSYRVSEDCEQCGCASHTLCSHRVAAQWYKTDHPALRCCYCGASDHTAHTHFAPASSDAIRDCEIRWHDGTHEVYRALCGALLDYSRKGGVTPETQAQARTAIDALRHHFARIEVALGLHMTAWHALQDTPSFAERFRDEKAHVQDALDAEQFALECELLVSKRLSIRTTAQLDLESGELDLCNENGLQVYDDEETVELLALLGSHRGTLYRRMRNK